MTRNYLTLSEREQIAIVNRVIAERESRKRNRRVAAFIYGCAFVDGTVVAFSPDWSLGASAFGLVLYLATAAYAALLLDSGLRKSAVEIEFGV